MLNIETKVKLNNWDATRSQVAMFASFSGNLKQKDSYFMLGNKRLKTREGPNRLGLIYYVRPDALKAKDSHYFLWHLNKVLFLITKSPPIFLWDIILAASFILRLESIT